MLAHLAVAYCSSAWPAQVTQGLRMPADGEDRCPWVARWLHAELPRRLGRAQASLNAMYDLHATAEQQWQRSQQAGATP